MNIREGIVEKFTQLINNEEEAKAIEENTFTFVTEHCKNNDIPQNVKNTMFRKLYVSKARQIYHNLKADSYVNNTQMLKLISKKKIKYEQIAFYSYKQLFPSKWKKFNKDLEILNKDIADFDKEVQSTDQFTCPKCKNNMTVYSQFQIRSSDEPITSFITCIHPDCNGHNWREG